MRAAVCREFGQPLSVEEVALRSLGPTDIHVDVAACAVCHSDIHYAEGAWGGYLPAVYGHEAAGVVKAVNGVKAQLAGAEKCYNAKDIAGAEKCFEGAQSLLKAMAKIYEPYAREMKKKSRGQKTAMQHDKDGKAILAFIETMEKTLPAVQKLIKSRMRASI